MPLPPSKIYSEYPLGIRMALLMNYGNPSGDYVRDVLPYDKAAERIEEKIVGRNAQGQQLEKELRIDEAIKLYERNVADFADTPHPYERLRIIYTKRKKYDDAIRVCQAYIDMSALLAKAISKELKNDELAQQLGNPGGFDEQIIRIKRLAGRDDSGFISSSLPIPSSNRPIQPTPKKSFPWKIIGIVIGVLVFGFCACIAFGMFLQAIGYGQ